MGVRWYWKNKLGAMGEYWTKASGVVIQNPQCIFFGCDVGIGKNTYFMPVVEHLGNKYSPKIRWYMDRNTKQFCRHTWHHYR